ncbi:MAG TPA: AAA family ATPase [Acidimicrobiia bacterium]|nr:AAA family ATPase [Acidimicrobiia bacterium]
MAGANPAFAQRFRREARLLARIDHPHVVTVFDFREHDDLHLLVMELLTGGTLAERKGRVSAETAIASVLAAASGLQHVHDGGILHRDVKPENLMFDRRGALKVTDFGIARGDSMYATAVDITHAREFFGTPAYVSPEQAGHALGEGWSAVGVHSDQYSLAAVLYELLTGRLTHDSSGGAIALCNRRMHDPARPLRDFAPSVPEEIEATVLRALARLPDDRYESVEAFAVALGTAAAHALGPGWLERSEVSIREPGAILDAARGTGRGAAVRVEPPAAIDVTVPLPARLRRSLDDVFAGRVEEQERWDDAWKLVRTGERGVWLVGGEAGVGKTSLISRLAARAHDDGAVVLYGRCDEDVGIPYQPWIEALSSLVTHAPRLLIEQHVAARGGELARLIPELSRRTGVAVSVASDAEAERYALFGAVADLLTRATTIDRIVVVLEDLHWADKPTVQLLRHLVQTAEPMRIMIVGTYRATDLGAAHPLTEAFAALRRERGVDFVDLRGLGDMELLALMEGIAGHELDADGLALRDAIAVETAGNAFFAHEILRHLVETGALVRQDGRWIATPDLAAHGLPVSVRQVVGERVARLGTDAQRLLRTASVIGREFDLRLVADAADVDEEVALDLLDAAVDAAVLHNVGPDRYTFAHALVEHTLYDELSPSRRGRMHRRIAEAIETRVGDDTDDVVGELAFHWSAALVPDDAQKAIEYARRAGERALEQLAPDEGLRWFTKAQQLHGAHGGDVHAYAQILVGLGAAQRQLGDETHRETLLAAANTARSIGDTDLLVAAVLANSRGWATLTGIVDEECVAAVEAALAAVGPDDSVERARLLAVLVAELTFDDDLVRRRAAADEAEAIARRIGDDRALVAALIGLLSLPDRPGTQHLVWADEAIALAVALDDPVSLAIASASAVTSATSFADRERFDRYLDLCTNASARVGQPMLLLRASGAQTLKAVLDGDLDGAEVLANDILAGAAGMSYAFVWYGSIIITIRGHQGRGAEVRQMIAMLAGDSQAGSISETARAGLLIADVQSHDFETARAGFAEQIEQGFSARDDQLWLTHVCINAHACARLEDREQAAPLLALLEPYADLVAATPSLCMFSAPSCAGALAALLGRDEDADRYFARAIEITARLRAPFLLATAQLEWARALTRRGLGATEQAATLVAAALAAAREHGYAEIERDALDLRAPGASH